jgi:hypothetical protein
LPEGAGPEEGRSVDAFKRLGKVEAVEAAGGKCQPADVGDLGIGFECEELQEFTRGKTLGFD